MRYLVRPNDCHALPAKVSNLWESSAQSSLVLLVKNY